VLGVGVGGGEGVGELLVLGLLLGLADWLGLALPVALGLVPGLLLLCVVVVLGVPPVETGGSVVGVGCTERDESPDAEDVEREWTPTNGTFGGFCNA
jgi:hypothetical protein